MDCIKHLLEPHTQEISKSENEQVALVYQMYEVLSQFLENILHTDWMTDKGSLALVGGIMINCDGEGTDRFLPLKFEIRRKTKTEDVYEEAFGKRPANPHRKGVPTDSRQL